MSKIKAIIIEDEMPATELLKSYLAALPDWTVLADFSNALDAISFLSHNTVDVIFLDINMPRMNGFEFLEAAIDELGEAFTHVVIVMLTTSLDPADRARAEQFSVVRDFINKPLTVDHVKRAAQLLKEARGEGT